jgi:hypothetical protein
MEMLKLTTFHQVYLSAINLQHYSIILAHNQLMMKPMMISQILQVIQKFAMITMEVKIIVLEPITMMMDLVHGLESYV